MINTQYAIPFFMAILLIPAGMVNAQTPGEDEFTELGSTGKTLDLLILESVLDDYLDELESEDDLDRKGYLENTVNRLDIARALILISQNSTNIPQEYQDLTIQNIFDLLDQTYGPEDYPPTNSEDYVESANIHTSTDVTQAKIIDASYTSSVNMDVLQFNNHHQTQYDCDDRRVVTGFASSTLISYTNGQAKIAGTFNYPEDLDKTVTDRRYSSCVDFDHDRTVKRHDVLASFIPGNYVPAQVCTLIETNPNGTEMVWCNAFGPDRITLITTHNSYDSSSGTTQLGNITTTILTS